MPTSVKLPTPAKNETKDRYRLAINLPDLSRIPGVIQAQLGLAKTIDPKPENLIKMDKDRPDEVGVVFTCELRWAALICDVIRNKDRKAGEYPTRVYLSKIGEGGEQRAWKRLPAETVLTELKGSMSCLDPKVFVVEEDKPKVMGTILPARVVVFGE